MNKITEFLKKNLLILAFILMTLMYVKSCTTSNKAQKVIKKQTVLLDQAAKVDSLQTVQVNDILLQLKRNEIQHQIDGLELAKRIVYDQNAIVRTVVRPDDKIREYDEAIKELKKKL